MEKTLLELKEGWRLAIIPHDELIKREKLPVTADECERENVNIEASVPGNFELDMEKAGLIEGPYYEGMKPAALYELEDRHLFYYTHFDKPCDIGADTVLRFDGIDTYADIYLNGEFVLHTENMFISHELALDPEKLKSRSNELLIHITPAMIAARKYEISPRSSAIEYNYASLSIRKAAYMFGWDIMPRTVSGGLWKPVRIVRREKLRIDKIYMFTHGIDLEKGKADINCFYKIESEEANIHDLELEAEGVCGDSHFKMRTKCWHTMGYLKGYSKNVKFWWPKNYGEQPVYDVTVRLFLKGELVDTYSLRFGVRTVKLERTSVARSEQDCGKFCFRINGKRIFIMGTNWVPLDAFPSRHLEKLPRALALMDDIGCNAVRVWGGNVYESDEFYDYCDDHGILVWQDFMMGCGVYPQDERMQRILREEAIYIVERLRNHPSLMLWAGDNECDCAQSWLHPSLDPNENVLTRNVLAEVVRNYDMLRPYLPSSPYIDEEAFSTKLPTTEDHVWGPRDYFKGEYYKNTLCSFSSETGYHGCPEPKSLASFISKERLWPMFENEKPNCEWILHCASPEPYSMGGFGYRIPLMTSQVKTMFGTVPEDLDMYSRASQISQAEAMKFFIERTRMTKWRRTGIMWWNIIDGWPQISDAVVDWFGNKKLAYYYIKRSQNPVCMAFSEPCDNKIGLHIMNDTQSPVNVKYTVKDGLTGEMICSGEAYADKDSAAKVCEIKAADAQRFYLISWEYDGKTHTNHYTEKTENISLEQYVEFMKNCGYREDFNF